MKKHSFYSLKRFLSLLILDRDIVEEKTQEVLSRKIEPDIHPIFPQMQEPTLSIQPEELGGIEDIDTRVFWDDESISPLFEEEEDAFLITPEPQEVPTHKEII